MLVPGSAAVSAARAHRRPVLGAIARRSLPGVIEATLAPAIVFYVFNVTLNARSAMVAVLVWTYGAVARRRLLRRDVPTVLALASLVLTFRTGVGFVTGSTFAYFIQPVATTLVLAGVFLVSIAFDRPVVARFANDFCPLAPDVAARPRVVRLFVGLTLLWSAVHLVTAATTLAMLLSLPVDLFVPLKTAACLAITATAIVLTVTWSINVADREDLVFAPVAP
jgi:intracellular septation protein A